MRTKRLRQLGKISVIGIMLMTLLFTELPISKAASTAPFLYYYSYKRSGFIVERADGTDSRVLANYKLPKDNDIGGPGWSPSGKWFAWANFFYLGISSKESFTIWAVSRDGHKVKSLLASPGQVMSMSWSPTEDLILVERVNVHEERDFEFDVLDVETGNLIIALYQPGAQVVPNGWIGINPEWTADGRYIALYYAVDYISGTSKYVMRLTTPDGKFVAERQFHRGEFPCYSSVFWSSKGSALYLDSGGQELIAEDFAHSETIRLSLDAGLIGTADWSPDGQYALLYMQSSCDVKTAQLWLLSLPDQTLMLISQDVKPLYPCCIGKPVLPSMPKTMWSPKRNQAVFLSPDNLLFMVTPVPFSIDTISVSDGGKVYHNSPVVWDSMGDALTFVWQPSPDDRKNQLITYRIISRTSAAITSRKGVGSFSYSADRNYVVLKGGCTEIDNPCVVDVTSGNAHKLELKYPDGTPPTSASEFIWHPKQDWVLAMGQTVDPGWYIDVVNADVSVQREIEECPIFAQSCYGWLPEP